MTRLILIRHGESEANLVGQFAGHYDIPLTALGLEQAEQTAAQLATERIDVVYSSDLRRAADTAKPHAERRGLTVIKRQDLREIYCGRWEGQTFSKIAETENDLFSYGFRDHFFAFSMPEGESVLECGLRFYQAVAQIAGENVGKTVLIVAHGAVLRAFWGMICGADFSDEQINAKYPYPSNASYSIVDFDGTHFIPVEFSHDSHLTTVTHLHI